MLKEFFGEIMENLSQESKLARFNLVLPEKKTEKGEIPESIMCQRLRNDLNEIKENGPIDNVNVLMCEKIILAFSSLYNKYINSQNAIFMINISSNNRSKLTHLFDKNYYKMMIKRQTTNERKINHNNSNEMSFIKLMVESNANDDQLITMLLREIIINTESSVLEISALMNDSFSRFKTDNRELVRTFSNSWVSSK